MTASSKQTSEPRKKGQQSLFALTRGYRLRYAAGLGALAAGIGFHFLVPLVLKASLDRLPVKGVGSGVPTASLEEPTLVQNLSEALLGSGTGTSMLIWAGFLILVLTSIGGVFQFLKGKLSAEASEGIVRGLRDRLYGHLERLPAHYHDKADTGDLVQRCSSDVDTVRIFLSGQVMEIGRAVLLVAAALPLMLGLHVGLTMISM
ncbi:MAG: ABC transporter ATP-binding protein, partial [Deltaproteobacteria bacterium]